MRNYLTKDEVAAAQSLHKRAPYVVCDVSESMFSLARHYGGMTLQGCDYTYISEYDECIRNDVLTMVTKMRKARAREHATESQQVAIDI